MIVHDMTMKWPHQKILGRIKKITQPEHWTVLIIQNSALDHGRLNLRRVLSLMVCLGWLAAVFQWFNLPAPICHEG